MPTHYELERIARRYHLSVQITPVTVGTNMYIGNVVFKKLGQNAFTNTDKCKNSIGHFNYDLKTGAVSRRIPAVEAEVFKKSAICAQSRIMNGNSLSTILSRVEPATMKLTQERWLSSYV